MTSIDAEAGAERRDVEPTMIRTYNGGHKGAIAFSRGRPFLETFFSALINPHLENHRKIHEAWGGRLASEPVSPDSPECFWRLPPYDSAVADSTYRYGSLFVRNGQGTAIA